MMMLSNTSLLSRGSDRLQRWLSSLFFLWLFASWIRALSSRAAVCVVVAVLIVAIPPRTVIRHRPSSNSSLSLFSIVPIRFRLGHNTQNSVIDHPIGRVIALFQKGWFDFGRYMDCCCCCSIRLSPNALSCYNVATSSCCWSIGCR